MLKFKNPDVAAKYTTDRTEDLEINFTGYHGKLSKISLHGAAYLVKTKAPYIMEKIADTAQTDTQE